jgi:hypothetical protein
MIRLREEMQTEKPTIHANVRNCSKDAHYIRGIFLNIWANSVQHCEPTK